MKPKTLSTSDLDGPAFDNQLTEDATRLPNLHMDEQGAMIVDAESRQQRLTTTKASKLLFASQMGIPHPAKSLDSEIEAPSVMPTVSATVRCIPFTAVTTSVIPTASV